MMVFLNGQWLPEEAARISVFDRGFLYGDSLFETIRVSHGRLFQFEAHFARLQAGADFLKIQLPRSKNELAKISAQLIERNDLANGTLRLQLSRGVGPRGYSPKSAREPALVISTHPASKHLPVSGWTLITASIRVPVDWPLARFKTGNKLPQILGRAEAEAAGADDALFINTAGHLAETSAANLFLCWEGKILTPPVSAGILPGITRELVLRLARECGGACQEKNLRPADLEHAEAAFVTLSSMGLVPVERWEHKKFPADHRLVQQLEEAYAQLLNRPSASPVQRNLK